MKTKSTFLAILLCCFAIHARAQVGLENSGNQMLNGAYYMRQVFYAVAAGTGALTASASVQGTITFNGAGGYTFSGSLENSTASPSFMTIVGSGSYVISASGEGYISPVDTSISIDNVIGLVSHGVFIGSTAETGSELNTLFIATPVGSQATNSTLNGAYTVAYFDATVPGDALFTMNANGSGGIGTINATVYSGTNTTAASQSLSGVTYVFSNGAAQIKFGGKRSSSTMIAGTDLLYISPDGNFIFGGSETGYDMFVGVRAATSAPSNYDALYYQAGLNFDASAEGSGLSPLGSYYGAFQARSGSIIGHQRFTTGSAIKYRALNSTLIYGGTSDFTYLDTYTLNSDGSSDDTAFSQHYLSSTDGTIRIGYGLGPYLSINVAFQAPSFSGSGVYLNPTGIVNAASSAPFTAQISAGEFLTLYGSGLASTTAAATVPFPTTLQGVQVFVNNVAAPVYYVSPTQISIVAPYGTDANTVAQIYVVNNSVNSNQVSAFTGLTSVGVFTNNPVGGLGYAAALHPDNSIVSQSSPAQIGESIAIYLAGMGLVTPPVQNGAAAPSSTLSTTTGTPFVYLIDASGNYLHANVAYSGLAPGFAGLYQINFTIPAGTASGDASLAVIGPDSASFESILPVTTSSSSAAARTGSRPISR